MSITEQLNIEMLKMVQTKKALCIPKQISENIEKKLKNALKSDTKKV